MGDGGFRLQVALSRQAQMPLKAVVAKGQGETVWGDNTIAFVPRSSRLGTNTTGTAALEA